MLLKDYLAVSARYNSSANSRLFASLGQLRSERYYQPVLACSRSIHGILNHVMAADLAWIGEMTEEPSSITSSDHTVCETREQLQHERERVDAEMIALVDQLSEADLMAMIQYDDAAAGPMQWPLMLEISHVFRHASHHRGQVTVLMEAMGVEPPKIDDLFLPDDMTFEVMSNESSQHLSPAEV
jgi:uncharacterized damage-inducible protein DinB